MVVVKRAAGVEAKAINWALIAQLIKLLMDLFMKSSKKLDQIDLERVQTKARELRDLLKGG